MRLGTSMKVKTLAVLAVAALMATGCADTYDDAEALAEEIGCTDVQPSEETGAASAVECAYSDHDGRLRLATFDDDEAFGRYLDARAMRLQPVVHGDDWTIAGHPDAVIDVHDEVGGSLIAVEP